MSVGIEISKKEFENFLERNYWWSPCPDELYGFDLLGKKDKNENLQVLEKEIWEILYFIPLIQEKVLLLVYSSIDRKTEKSRTVGGDSMKIVPFSYSRFEPVMRRQHTIYRVDGWKNNFKKRVDEIVKKLGNDMVCKNCGSTLSVGKNTKKKDSHFLGCKSYLKKGCRGKDVIANIK